MENKNNLNLSDGLCDPPSLNNSLPELIYSSDEEADNVPSNSYNKYSKEKLRTIATTLNEIILELKIQNSLLKQKVAQYELSHIHCNMCGHTIKNQFDEIPYKQFNKYIVCNMCGHTIKNQFDISKHTDLKKDNIEDNKLKYGLYNNDYSNGKTCISLNILPPPLDSITLAYPDDVVQVEPLAKSINPNIFKKIDEEIDKKYILDDTFNEAKIILYDELSFNEHENSEIESDEEIVINI